MLSSSDPDDIDVTDELLAGDRSKPGWKRRAVGMPRERALEYRPRHGLLQGSIPIECFRAVQEHIRARGMTQAAWMREAAAAYLLAQGGSREVARKMLEPRQSGMQ